MIARRGPSLAKTRAPALIERDGSRVRTTNGRWRELFARADVMSEGMIREEVGERVWYGSTSLILELPVETSLEDRAELLAIARKDVHAHVHVLRSAHREAQSRAPGPSKLISNVRAPIRPRWRTSWYIRDAVSVPPPSASRSTPASGPGG